MHLEHMIKPEWKNPARGAQTKDVMKKYFVQLSKSQIADLYEMFRYVNIFLIVLQLNLRILDH